MIIILRCNGFEVREEKRYKSGWFGGVACLVKLHAPHVVRPVSLGLARDEVRVTTARDWMQTAGVRIRATRAQGGSLWLERFGQS